MHAKSRSLPSAPAPSGALVVRDPDTGAAHEIDALAAAVWQAADGATDLEGLVAAASAVDATADRTHVWEALDDLAQRGLLEQAVAPPSAPTLSRRTWMARAAAFGAAVAVLPAAARADQPAAVAEQHAKQQAAQGPNQEETMKGAGVCGAPALRRSLEERQKQGPRGATEAQHKALRQREANRKRAQESSRKARYESFGTGTAPVWMDLPDGDTLEGEVDLAKITTDGVEGTGCELSMELTFDYLLGKEGARIERLRDQLKRLAPDPTADVQPEVWLQFGAEAEYALSAYVVDLGFAYTATTPDGKPVRAVAKIRFVEA